MKKVKLSIPEPCHEDWEQMTPTERGRFCAACEKVVTDYTQWSQTELTEQIKKGNLGCGRFRLDQLQHTYVLEPQSQAWRRAASLLFPLLLGGANLAAQSSLPPITKTERTLSEKKTTPSDERGPIILSGTVIDETGEALIGASIYIKETFTGTSTDHNGFFSLSAKSDTETLVISYMGYKTYSLSAKDFTNRDSQVITLEESFEELDAIVLTGNKSVTGKIVVGMIFSKYTLEEPEVKKMFAQKVSNIQVSPNPFQGELNIQFHLAEAQNMQFQFINAAGQQVAGMSYKGNPGFNEIQWSISTTNLSGGMYFLRLVSKNRVQETVNVLYQR